MRQVRRSIGLGFAKAVHLRSPTFARCLWSRTDSYRIISAPAAASAKAWHGLLSIGWVQTALSLARGSFGDRARGERRLLPRNSCSCCVDGPWRRRRFGKARLRSIRSFGLKSLMTGANWRATSRFWERPRSAGFPRRKYPGSRVGRAPSRYDAH